MTALNLEQIIKFYYPEFSEVQEMPILGNNKTILGWHSSVIINDGKAIGSGTAKDRDTARRIAVAESVERGFLLHCSSDDVKSREFMLNLINSSSGFAAGFNNTATGFRSMCESVERWAWSQWIDKSCFITQVTPVISNALTQSLLSRFQSVQFYKTSLTVKLGDYLRPLQFGIILGFTDEGVFAGSRVTSPSDDPWEHAAIEVSRNLHLFSHLNSIDESEIQSLTWFQRRILYFGKNRASALKQIPSISSVKPQTKWPMPVVVFQKNTSPFEGVFVWRTLCSNFVPWHLGPDDRFVY